MGKGLIKEDMFPEITDKYNREGRSAACAMLREEYGIRRPDKVIARIRKSAAYSYDAAADRFTCPGPDPEEAGIFLGLDGLCNPVPVPPGSTASACGKAVEMEKLVQELIGDRLLALSRYITMDTSSRTVLVDRSLLIADGYRVELH